MKENYMSILVDFKDTYWVELYSYNNIHSKHPELLFAFTYFTYLFNLNMADNRYRHVFSIAPQLKCCSLFSIGEGGAG